MGKKQVNIHIGQMYASQHPAVIYTLLGSCVAVCLFDPVARVGGMNHILLPGSADLRHQAQAARYGDNAIAMLLKRILNVGAIRERVVAKAFGGAHLFKDMSLENSTGLKIVDAVLACLKREGLRLVNQDLGGNYTRKLFFHTDTGDAFLKRLQPDDNRQALQIERDLIGQYASFNRQKL
jgi:chemotaxis protein CheD